MLFNNMKWVDFMQTLPIPGLPHFAMLILLFPNQVHEIQYQCSGSQNFGGLHLLQRLNLGINYKFPCGFKLVSFSSHFSTTHSNSASLTVSILVYSTSWLLGSSSCESFCWLSKYLIKGTQIRMQVQERNKCTI